MDETMKADISTRILETRKQTEQLKAQLQNLIDSGINSSLEYNKGSDYNLDKENLTESQNKLQIIKSFDPKYSQHVNKPTQSKIVSSAKQKDKKAEQDLNKESPKKVRSYDVKEAREYIKRQREKRLEQLKSQNSEKIKAELQRKRLQDLHKKSLELVTKNVQAKRERSISRDRKGYVRPDQDTRTRTRSYSRDRNCTLGSNDIKCDIKRTRSADRFRNNQPRMEKRNPNLLYPPTPAYMLRAQEAKKDRNKPEKRLNETLKPSGNQKNVIGDNVSKNVQEEFQKSSDTVKDDGDTFSKTLKPSNMFNKTKSQCRLEESAKIIENDSCIPVVNILDYANSTKNVTLRCTNKSADLILSEPVSLRESQKENKRKARAKLSEVAIGTDNLEKDTKETQTGNEQKTEFPIWLQEKPMTYPFNFINSVKRKLQDAVNCSKQSVDVGVQSSIVEERQKTPENTKTKEAIMEILQNSTKSSKKSDLKSFISHKCLNLDPKTIDHLELIPKMSNYRNETITKVSETESESDTSKNIPEISSESASRSPKQNGSGLNVERLNRLKLIAHVDSVDQTDSALKTSKSNKQKSTDIRINTDTEKSDLLTVDGEYTSDFQTGSELSKSRESIIAFNSPTYNKQIISNRSPEYQKNSTKYSGSDVHSSYIPEIISTIHSKDIPDPVSNLGRKPRNNHKQNYLNVERLSKLQLVTHNLENGTTLPESEQKIPALKNLKNHKLTGDTKKHETKKSNLLTVGNGYTSDFQSGSDLSKIRVSIISSNSPSYNKQIIPSSSPDYDTRLKGGNSEKHSSNIPTTVSTKSNNLEKRLSSGTFSVNTVRSEISANISNPKSSTKSSAVSTKREIGIKENKSSTSIPTETESHKTKSSHDSNISEKYTSLYTDLASDATSKSNSSLVNVNTRRGSDNFSKSDKLTEVFPLKEPTISLVVANEEIRGKYKEKEDMSTLMKNISLRSNKSLAPGELNNTNEIHLKFEAEIHLLNDFNESLRQFSAVEKAFESLKSKNDNTSTVDKILQNRDTQTSVVTKSSTGTKVTENINTPERTRSEISTINYSRGSFIDEDSSSIRLDDTISRLHERSLVSTVAEVSNRNNKSSSSVMKSSPDLSNFENLQPGNCAEMTLRMFEQLIKDEDVRLENLKTILKIREQALLDRTKGELAWLEIQRKHLRETGKLQEASLIKKKQRGILVNHQKEKHEMLRLKQMQKAASIERKIILKEQRNLIKHQLSTDTMLSKMKVNTPRERRLSGPLKVIQSHSESIRSETSISKRSSSEKDVYSITSHTHSIVSKVSEISGDDVASRDVTSDVDAVNLAGKLTGDGGMPVSQMKKTLLMREAALQKRRKAAEELLRWHKKLLEEERRITELESTANAIISRIPSDAPTATTTDKYKFRGKQLNQLWLNLTGCEEKKFADDKIYPMSQISLERFCKSAREYSAKTKRLLRKASDSECSEQRTDDSASVNIPGRKDLSANRTVPDRRHSITTAEYASDFDVESIQEIVADKDMDVVDHNLNQLIDNFSRIEADISSLGIKQSLKSGDDQDGEGSPRSENTGSDVEVSVIETNKTSREEKSDSGKALDSGTPEKIVSNKNLSIIEEINKSTRDTLSRSEEVLLKLSLAEDSVREIDEIEEPSGITYDPPKESSFLESACEEIPEKLSKTEDRISSDSRKSRTDETTDTLNKARQILERLSQSEDSITPASPKKSSLIEDNLASNKTLDNLNKTEEILDRLSRTEAGIISEISSNNKSSIPEDKLSGTIDNLNKSEEILENLSLLGNKVASDVSSKEKSSIPEDKPSGTIDNLNKTEDILESLSLLENKIASDISSNKKSSTIEEVSKSTKTDDLWIPSAVEEKITPGDSSRKSSIAEDKIPADVTSAKESPVIEENPPTGITIDLTGDEEPLLELYRAEDKEISSGISEEREKSIGADDELDKGGETKLAEGNSKSLSKISSIPEDLERRSDSKKAEEVSDSPKDTYVDEELSADGPGSRLEAVEEVIEIDDDEQSFIEIKDDGEDEIEIEADEENADCKGSKQLEEVAISKDAETEESISEEGVETGGDLEGSKEEKSSSRPGSVSTKPTTTDIEESKEDRSGQTGVSASEASLTKEDINSYEEKELDSLSSASSGVSDKTEEKSKSEGSKGSFSEDKSPRSGTVDVKKRVSEIMADTSQPSRGDRSPRMQDLYVTAYDLVSPANSPELGSPVEEQRIFAAKSIFGTEAEEILRKQLAIEQEIKLITEQQQKEHVPYMYVREIPNKPPPPYTPPSSLPPANVVTIIPTTQEIEEITKYSAKILHKAHLSSSLDNISISENTLGLISKNVTKECYKFVFDICKEVTKEHYKQFEKEQCVSWLEVKKKPQLAEVKPLDVNGLERHLNKNLKELFGYEKPNRRENAIIKWSRKKRDHVDEILVMESQVEENQWTNYEKDELLVMNEVTNEIMNMLLKETGDVFSKILSKRT